DLGAESLRLRHGTSSGISTREARGKTEIILDARAGACLSTGRAALHENRAQSFRSAVHRRGESRRPAADHDEIVERFLRTRLHAEAFGELARTGVREPATVGKQHHRQLR